LTACIRHGETSRSAIGPKRRRGLAITRGSTPAAVSAVVFVCVGGGLSIRCSSYGGERGIAVGIEAILGHFGFAELFIALPGLALLPEPETKDDECCYYDNGDDDGNGDLG
jgi:hypothetical protein